MIMEILQHLVDMEDVLLIKLVQSGELEKELLVEVMLLQILLILSR